MLALLYCTVRILYCTRLIGGIGLYCTVLTVLYVLCCTPWFGDSCDLPYCTTPLTSPPPAARGNRLDSASLQHGACARDGHVLAGFLCIPRPRKAAPVLCPGLSTVLHTYCTCAALHRTVQYCILTVLYTVLYGYRCGRRRRRPAVDHKARLQRRAAGEKARHPRWAADHQGGPSPASK